jgi:hypothetical protein
MNKNWGTNYRLSRRAVRFRFVLRPQAGRATTRKLRACGGFSQLCRRAGAGGGSDVGVLTVEHVDVEAAH